MQQLILHFLNVFRLMFLSVLSSIRLVEVQTRDRSGEGSEPAQGTSSRRKELRVWPRVHSDQYDGTGTRL